MDDDVVRVSLEVMNHQFGLAEEEDFWDPASDPGGNGLAYPRPGGVDVYTGIDTGGIDVTVQTSSSTVAAPADLAGWDDVVEVEFSATGPLRLRSHEDEGAVVVRPNSAGPIRYACRVFVSGRDADFDMAVEESSEHYLLQVWPSEEGLPERTLKQTDSVGEGRRAW
jgi:hypothetical protein